MAANALSFRMFEEEVEEWELFKEQLEEFFKSAKVPAEGKVPVLVNCLKVPTYKLLRDLCTPARPSTKTYDELCILLGCHFTPTTVVHKERRIFFTATRGENGPEPVKMWLARIKRLSANCKFGDQLAHNLTNKFICGLTGKAFDRVCEEDEKVTLEKALALALKYDEEEKEAQPVNLLKKTQRPRADKEPRGELKCYACGAPGHVRSKCRFREAVCRRCRMKGHIEAACLRKTEHFVEVRTPSSPVQEEGYGEEEDDVKLEHNFLSKADPVVYSIISPKSESAPFKAVVSVGKQTFAMEIDSGAAISAVSESFRRAKLAQLEVRSTKLSLMGYSGECLKVLGCVEPELVFNGVTKRVVFAIVEKGGPPLLGRNFIKAFGLQILPMNVMSVSNVNDKLEGLLRRYDDLFSGKLGSYKGMEVDITLEDGAKPVFCKPRPVPFSFEEAVEKELNTAVEMGVLTKCDSSDWGTPVVPVLKDDGKSIRLCGDYKITVNKYVKEVRHPLPRIEEVMAKLNGGKLFSKLDLSRAYNQFVLTEESRRVCALSTHKGVFLMNRLPFGIKTSSGIVQREMEKLFANEPFVITFIDDVLITGRNDEEHLATLERVLEILHRSGLTLRKDKCTFFKKKVSYLGFEITENGVTKTQDRLKAIVAAKAPENVSEVRAFAGMMNYYGRFIKDLSTIMSPLYELLKKGSKFVWSQSCQAAFERAKQEVCKDVSLSHFDPKKEIVLICDASNVGVSAVLAHREHNEDRPIAFASRTLSPSEKGYSVLQKEGLAIVFGLNKYYFYLAGNKVTIKTDHKPLVAIFGPQKGVPVMAAGRMQRWANFISGFQYQMDHISSEENVADYPSRCPVESWELWKEDGTYLNFITSGSKLSLDTDALRAATEGDKVLSFVRQQVLLGKKQGLQNDEFQAFARIYEELAVENDIVMRGFRVVVPASLRQVVLEELHTAHLGVNKSKSVARGYFWWPGLDEAIESHIRGCSACLSEQPSPPLAELIPWEVPIRPWSRIHVDYAGPIQGVWYLIVIDALTKWPEVFPTRTITATFTIERLMECMARFGLVDEIVSDNGTQFTAKEFKSFVEANGIKHNLTAPGHPASNGAAENFVKTFKSALKKACNDGLGRRSSEVLNNFLMAYRKSTHCSSKLSPAVALLGREMVTKFDRMLPQSTKPEVPKLDVLKENLTTAQRKQQRQFKGSRIHEFCPGEKVLVRDYSDPNHTKWEKAVVDQVLGKRNYLVTLSSSRRRIKRHLDQMVPDTSVAKAGARMFPKSGGASSVPSRPSSSLLSGNYSAKIVLGSETKASTQPAAVQPESREGAESPVGPQETQELGDMVGEEEVRGFDTGWSVQGKKRKVKEVFPDPYARKTSKRLKRSKYDQLLRMFLPLQNSACEKSEHKPNSNGPNGELSENQHA